MSPPATVNLLCAKSSRIPKHRPLSPARRRLVEIGCVEMFNRMLPGRPSTAKLIRRRWPAEAFACNVSLHRFAFAPRPLFAKWSMISANSRGCPLVDPQRVFRLSFHQCRALPHQAGRRCARELCRHAYCWPAQASGLSTGSSIAARSTRRQILGRTNHGALLDAELLAESTIYLIGATAVLNSSWPRKARKSASAISIEMWPRRQRRGASCAAVTDTDREGACGAFIATLGEQADLEQTFVFTCGLVFIVFLA